MSITCQVWDLNYDLVTDSLKLKCKIWTPCKLGELEEDLTRYEHLPNFVVEGYYCSRHQIVAPTTITLKNIKQWPKFSRFYLLADYGPFTFYVPDWDLITKAPAEIYLNAYKRYNSVIEDSPSR